VPEASLEGAVEKVLEAFRASSPQGLRETKRLVTASLRARLEAGSDEMVALSTRLFGSDEAREGMLAFLERRPPAWATLSPPTDSRRP
jgi:enoyl-CoA hydratase